MGDPHCWLCRCDNEKDWACGIALLLIQLNAEDVKCTDFYKNISKAL